MNDLFAKRRPTASRKESDLDDKLDNLNPDDIVIPDTPEEAVRLTNQSLFDKTAAGVRKLNRDLQELRASDEPVEAAYARSLAEVALFLSCARLFWFDEEDLRPDQIASLNALADVIN